MKKSNQLISISIFIVIHLFLANVAIGNPIIKQDLKQESAQCGLDKKTPKYIQSQTRAELAVVNLDEYKKLQKSTSNLDRILIDSRLRRADELNIKHCVWEVSVFTDFATQGRRLLWHIFLVDQNKVKFVMNSDGEFEHFQ